MRALALDGGEKVGWARADIDENGEWSDVRHGITPLWDMAIAVHSTLTDDADGSYYDLVILEDWALWPAKAKEFSGSRFPTVQFNGAVKLACKVSGTKLVIQQPAQKASAVAAMAKLNPELHEQVTRGVRTTTAMIKMR